MPPSMATLATLLGRKQPSCRNSEDADGDAGGGEIVEKDREEIDAIVAADFDDQSPPEEVPEEDERQIPDEEAGLEEISPHEPCGEEAEAGVILQGLGAEPVIAE